jgi:hypothetical protein
MPASAGMTEGGYFPLQNDRVLYGEPLSAPYFSLRTRFMTTGHLFRQLKHWAESSLE